MGAALWGVFVTCASALYRGHICTAPLTLFSGIGDPSASREFLERERAVFLVTRWGRGHWHLVPGARNGEGAAICRPGFTGNSGSIPNSCALGEFI